jgi:hypothetical protein
MDVPTFDIDLIWHTNMRYPSDYHAFTKVECGFILNHDDSIESSILSDAFQSTAKRGKQTYQTEYGTHVYRKHLITSPYPSSCAVVFAPILIFISIERPTHPAWLTVYGPSCAYIGGSVDIGDNAGGFASAECGGDNSGGAEGDSGCRDNGGCGSGCGGD